MSVSSILNNNGKVPQAYLELAAGVATEALALPSGSVAPAIAVADDLRLAAGKSLEFAGDLNLVGVNNNALVITSTGAESAVVAGAATGTYLRVKLNGVFYKLALLADV